MYYNCFMGQKCAFLPNKKKLFWHALKSPHKRNRVRWCCYAALRCHACIRISISSNIAVLYMKYSYNENYEDRCPFVKWNLSVCSLFFFAREMTNAPATPPPPPTNPGSSKARYGLGTLLLFIMIITTIKCMYL